MKRKNSLGVVFVAMLFLCIGIIWAFVIVSRNSSLWKSQCKERPSINIMRTMDYGQLKKEMKQMMTNPAVRKKISSEGLILMWVLLVLELVCCLFYLFAGLALLRRYVFARGLALFVVFMDVTYKTLMNISAQSIVVKKSLKFSGWNRMLPYYTQGKGVLSVFSDYFSGLHIWDNEAIFHLIVFSLYIIVVVFLLTRPKTREYFQKQGNNA